MLPTSVHMVNIAKQIQLMHKLGLFCYNSVIFNLSLYYADSIFASPIAKKSTNMKQNQTTNRPAEHFKYKDQ
jgi:hypothetical protein